MYVSSFKKVYYLKGWTGEKMNFFIKLSFSKVTKIEFSGVFSVNFANFVRCSRKLLKFHRKTPLLESPFNKVFSNFIKKWLQRRRFPVNFTKLIRTGIFREHLRWLSLNLPQALKKVGIVIQGGLTTYWNEF